MKWKWLTKVVQIIETVLQVLKIIDTKRKGEDNSNDKTIN